MAYMDKKKPYRIVASGKKAERRDYSKVSGKLELPNLVEIHMNPFLSRTTLNVCRPPRPSSVPR